MLNSFSLLNSQSNLTACKIAGFLGLFFKIAALSEWFQFKTRRTFKWGREWTRSPAKQRLHSTELWYNSSYSSSGWLQNKLVSIGKQARGWGEPTRGTRGSSMSDGHCSLHHPAFEAGWLGRMHNSHAAPNPLKIQLNGNQASAQQDMSDSCHQAEGANFVSFCHSNSGDSCNGDLQVAP